MTSSANPAAQTPRRHWRYYLQPDAREQAPYSLRLALTFAAVAALHLCGIGLILASLISSSPQAMHAGAALIAYLAGLRHAVDADHVCAIDNAIRRFVSQGRRPASVGLAFSLGHSTVVAITAFAVMAGVHGAESLVSTNNTTTAMLGVIGGVVSGGFLLLIGTANLVTLLQLRGKGDFGKSSATTAVGHLMAAPLRKVRHQRHIYLVGLLFGLGFDTAGLVGLLVLTAATAASGTAWLFAAALPVCFAAGMTLADTTNAILMLRLYTRTDPRSAGRIRMNVAVTAMSVVSAFTVAFVVLVGTARDAFSWNDPVTGWISGIDLEVAGYVLLAGFAGLWASSALWIAVQRRRSRHRANEGTR